MNTKAFAIFLTIVGFTFGREGGVLNLTNDDFASRIADIDVTLVMFYDHWCTYCNNLIPQLDKANELLSDSYSQIAIAKVNCRTDGKSICLEYDVEIREYPLLKIFRRGTLGQDYGGPEDAVGLAKFLRNRYGNPTTELLNLADIEKFLKTDEPSVIGFFDGDDELKEFFLKYADHFKDDYNFAYTSAPDILSKYDEPNSIIFFRAPKYRNKFEPNSIIYKGLSSEVLTDLIKRNVYGLVGHRTSENLEDFQRPYVVAYYPVDFKNNLKQTNYWRNRILQVAKDFSTDFTFAVSSSDAFQTELSAYGFGYVEKPVIAARDKDNKKFKMTAEFSIENFRQFLKDFKDGKLKVFVKSEPIPKTNDGPVKIAVANNFKEVVIDNGKDTLLEIYAPWCSYCKRLVPIYEELGTAMLDEDVDIVKFDATNNELPFDFELQGYPTLLWYPKDAKHKPQRYTDGHNVESFIKYIAEQATNELKKYDRNGEVKLEEVNKTEL